MNKYVRSAEFHALPTGRMGNSAPACAALDTWTRPACLRKHRRMRELMPEPRRLAFGRTYHWHREDGEAFTDSLLASMRPARPAVRVD